MRFDLEPFDHIIFIRVFHSFGNFSNPIAGKYFDEISGISFLPHSDHTYVQAPYQDATKEEYNALLKETPKHIDWTSFIEEDDNTEGSQTLACTGGSCEI